MPFVDTFFSRAERYSLGTETDSGLRYLSIPVSNGLVDWEEYYELDEPEYRLFIADPASAVLFAESCRQRGRDDRLLEKPSGHRGSAV